MFLEIGLHFERLAAFLNTLPLGSMCFKLMGKPCFAGIVESIGDRAMLMGTAVWM
jgi:hypothetical protein